MSRRAGFVSVLLAVAVFTTGCWFGTGSTSDLRYEYSRRTGVELEPEFGVKLGRVSTGFAKMFVKNHDDDLPLKGVAKIEVGVYNVVDPGERGPDLNALELEGWVTIVRIRDGDEHVQVMCRPDGERIRAMVVLVQDDEELVVVRLKGKLDKLIRAAVKQNGLSGIGDGFDDLG